MLRARPLLLLLLAGVTGCVAARPNAAAAPAASEIPADLRADRWDAALAAAARSPDPVSPKLVTFYRLLAPYQAGDPAAPHAAEIVAFLRDNPDWPQRALLARRRDEALARDPDDLSVQPLCGEVTLPGALLRCAMVEPQAAATLVQRAWLTGITDPGAEAAFMQRWGALLAPQDQWRRFAALAAEGNLAAAARQVERLAGPERRAAETWLALRRDDAKAEAQFAALPAEQRAEPLLVLEMARHLRRAGRDDEALAWWQQAGFAAERAAPRPAFWSERDALARRLLSAGNVSGAIVLADDTVETAPAPRTEAAFLTGFIALRRAGDPAGAAAHFAVLAQSPAAITKARGEYWLARAAEAQHAADEAKRHYAAAAAWPTTYYGQLAAWALHDDVGVLVRDTPDPAWSSAQGLAFAGREPARAAALLVGWNDPHRARAFLLRLQEVDPDAVAQSLDADYANALHLPDMAVAIARRAGAEGVMLPRAGWPVPFAIPDAEVPVPLALGVIRQESSFDPGAQSPAGARGLMQLMPATAQEMTMRVGLAPVSQLDPSALFDATLNLRLGCAYLASLLGRFGGSVPLAVAAYNAGPGRVRQWQAESGDPLSGQADMIDWIELIPFAETRNYVQRVIENMVVYAATRAGPQPMAPWLTLP